MDVESNRNVGRSELSGESSSVSAPRETDQTPAVTRPGAGLTSTMVTRSRAREGRSMSVDPEVEFRPETGARRGEEIPVPTSALCEMGLPAARPSSTGVLTPGMTEIRPSNTVATVVGAYPSSPHDTGIPRNFPTFHALSYTHTPHTGPSNTASIIFHNTTN